MASRAATRPIARGCVGRGRGALSSAWTRVGRSFGYCASPTASRKRSRISVSFIGAHLRAESQPLQCAIGSRLGGLGGNSSRLGDLFEREIEVVAKDDDESLVVGKAVQGAAQVGDRGIGRTRLPFWVAGESSPFDHRPPAVPALAATFVGDDREQPWLEIGAAPKLSEVAPGVQDGALKDRKSTRLRAKQPKREPVRRRQEGPEQEQDLVRITRAEVADHNRREAHSTVLSTSPAKSPSRAPKT